MSDSFHPGDQTRCPVCKGTFAVPDMREIDGDPTRLDCHCPLCGYGYARWPKALRVTDIPPEYQPPQTGG